MGSNERSAADSLWLYFLITRGEKFLKKGIWLSALLTLVGVAMLAYNFYTKMTSDDSGSGYYGYAPPPGPFYFNWVIALVVIFAGAVAWICFASYRTFLFVTVNTGTVVQHDDYMGQYGRMYQLKVVGQNRAGQERAQWHDVSQTTWTKFKDGDKINFC